MLLCVPGPGDVRDHDESRQTRGEVQTLQARYAEVKAAAEKYQILQVGLTICRENLVTGVCTQKGYKCIGGADPIQGNTSSCHTTSI